MRSLKGAPKLTNRSADWRLWLLALCMSYLLATISITAYSALNLTTRWMQESLPIVTIQIPESDLPLHTGGEQGNATRFERVLSLLQALPHDTQIHRLNKREVNHLLEPLLGDTEHDSLPLPAILRIKLPEKAVYPPSLDGQLAEEVPGTLTEHGTAWEKHLQILAYRLRLLTTVITLPIALACTIISFLGLCSYLRKTRGLLVHMHFLGATDGYLVRRLCMRTVRIGLWGTLCGCLLSLIPYLFFLRYATSLFDDVTFSWPSLMEQTVTLTHHYHHILSQLAQAFLGIGVIIVTFNIVVTWISTRHFLKRQL